LIYTRASALDSQRQSLSKFRDSRPEDLPRRDSMSYSPHVLHCSPSRWHKSLTPNRRGVVVPGCPTRPTEMIVLVARRTPNFCAPRRTSPCQWRTTCQGGGGQLKVTLREVRQEWQYSYRGPDPCEDVIGVAWDPPGAVAESPRPRCGRYTAGCAVSSGSRSVITLGDSPGRAGGA